jgi:hypothetical protein
LTLCSHTDREITVRKAPLAMLFLLTLLATLVFPSGAG